MLTQLFAVAAAVLIVARYRGGRTREVSVDSTEEGSQSTQKLASRSKVSRNERSSGFGLTQRWMRLAIRLVSANDAPDP